MRFTDIDVNFDIKYEGQQNCPKILSMDILRVLSDHYMWCQNWRQYVWTSLCQFIFFVHLLHSLGVWFFDIWQKDVKYVSHYSLLCPVSKDPCRTRMHPCTHLDLLGISQNLFATARFIISSNAMKKVQIAWHWGILTKKVTNMCPSKDFQILTLHTLRASLDWSLTSFLTSQPKYKTYSDPSKKIHDVSISNHKSQKFSKGAFW